jgi:type II restriction/modification system DNA methylase subunit YeeA
LAGTIADIPYPTPTDQQKAEVERLAQRLSLIACEDWRAFERSWEFKAPDIILAPRRSLAPSYSYISEQNRAKVAEARELEERVNHIFINMCGLQDDLESCVATEHITLTANPTYRYSDTENRKYTPEDREGRFREDTMQELVSYAVGCVMGRYSLDEPGLVYAHSGNAGFDSSRYTKFPADDDGIVPVTDAPWFEDDAATRLEEFLSVAWAPEHLEENLTFLADNLSPNKNEISRDTLRRYLCDKFFKDHLQTYKNRPIYWLFTSGKQKAFQCLVYLHRYNEGTLARMRSEYVIPLQGKMAARLAHLEDDRKVASPAQQKRIDKESAKLKKQQAELLEFDEKLRHYADRRISLDLDDGVKVNYGKFGSLLAEVEKIHGQKAEGP